MSAWSVRRRMKARRMRSPNAWSAATRSLSRSTRTSRTSASVGGHGGHENRLSGQQRQVPQEPAGAVDGDQPRLRCGLLDHGDLALQHHEEAAVRSPSQNSTVPCRHAPAVAVPRQRHELLVGESRVGAAEVGGLRLVGGNPQVRRTARRHSTTSSSPPVRSTGRRRGPVDAACPRACRIGDESQQPTWPQVRHWRRCTHGVPSRTHSAHTRRAGGGTGRMIARCGSAPTRVGLAVITPSSGAWTRATSAAGAPAGRRSACRPPGRGRG